MNAHIRQAISALNTLRLPELQARYLEVLGTPSRCPNRGFLVRKISEALAAREAQHDGSRANVTAPEVQPAGDSSSDEEAFSPHELPTLTAVDLPIVETEAPLHEPEPKSAGGSQPATKTATNTHALPRGRFRGMTVEELQRKYLEVVGRPSNSENKAYLVWKIREAEKGHVPVGPIDGRGRGISSVDVKVLPLRIEAAALDHIDQAWRRHGLKNRTRFLRSAIEHYLAHLDARAPASAGA